MSKLDSAVNQLLEEINDNTDLTHELQTKIHPDINFKYNSVNLLVGKRGSGKTFNCFRELLKLKFIKNHKYSQLVYVTDKMSDMTFERIKDVLPIPYKKVSYDDAVEVITDITCAKEILREAYEKSDLTAITKDAAELVKDTLQTKIIKQPIIIHTAVLFDDCQQIFEKKTKVNEKLFRLLFENRQPKITYFLCLQDPLGLASQVKQNLDGLWIFGGFCRTKFIYLYNQITIDADKEKLLTHYNKLNKRQALILDFDDDGTFIKTLES